VLIRLASRLQTLRWLATEKRPCDPMLARETLDLYTPLANRLGIWQIKWEMEDLAFRFTDPQRYKEIAKLLEEKRIEREDFIAQTVEKENLSPVRFQINNKTGGSGVTAMTYMAEKKAATKDLPGNQEKIDVNKNGKIDGDDLAKLRAGKKEVVKESTDLDRMKQLMTRLNG
jgi:GTP pyrophosphokinase